MVCKGLGAGNVFLKMREEKEDNLFSPTSFKPSPIYPSSVLLHRLVFSCQVCYCCISGDGPSEKNGIVFVASQLWMRLGRVKVDLHSGVPVSLLAEVSCGGFNCLPN